jgi:FkbM family methyltransferase
MNPLRLLLQSFRRLAPAEAAKPTSLTLEQYQSIEPRFSVHEGDIEVLFAAPNLAVKYRVDSLRSKEPDTIEWIQSFQANDVFVDIGANVGMYTVWAAKTRGVRTFAFEPESQNYALLYKNIVLNGLTEQVVAYCLALSDEQAYSKLYLRDFHAGGSCHTFGEKLDPHLKQRESVYTQGCISTTLDRLVANGVIPTPNHIKIDVDGLEHKVLHGCRNVLSAPQLKSVLVEINTNLEPHRNIIRDMSDLGFIHSSEQVAKALRSAGAFAGVGNHIFHR